MSSYLYLPMLKGDDNIVARGNAQATFDSLVLRTMHTAERPSALLLEMPRKIVYELLSDNARALIRMVDQAKSHILF